MMGKYKKKKAFYDLLAKASRDKWDKINSKFATNDDPVGMKLMSTGCMERFDHAREEERMDKVLSQQVERGSGLEAYKEQQNINKITNDMELDEILDILNPEERRPWEVE
jgi:hypothetical protein